MNDQSATPRGRLSESGNASVAPTPGKTTLTIAKMDCPSEEKLIRERLARVRGVGALTFDLAARKLTLQHEGEIGPALSALQEIGLPADVAKSSSASSRSVACYRIENMDCPSEEKLIRTKLAAVSGVEDLQFDLANRTLRVTHTLASPETIERALAAAGMRAVRFNADTQTDAASAPTAAPSCCGAQALSVTPPQTRPVPRLAVFSIENMDCPTEEKLIRDRLSRERGVSSLSFNLVQRKLTVEHELPDVKPILAALKGVGMKTELVEPEPPKEGKTSMYRIDNMDCPTEEALIRDKLSNVAGITDLEFNLMQRTLGVRHTLPSTEPIEKALHDVGMHAAPVAPPAGVQTTVLAIAKMDCPTEEKLIRDKLTTLQGIETMQFNLVQRTLTLTHASEALEPVLGALKSIGLEAQIQAEQKSQTLQPPPRTNWWPMIISGSAASAAEAIYWYVGGNHWLVVAFALIAIFTGGFQTYKKGWIAVKNRNLNMNALMSIAVTGAMLIGQWPEAAMVMFLFALAEVIEAKSLDRARDAIRGLMELAPERATVKQPDGSWREAEAKAIPVDAIVRVRPGERIALDGRIVEGRSTVNQAPITGESLPVDKGPGDPVFAGTINDSGSFEFRVTAPASDSTLARIIHAVEVAQSERAPTQRFVDQFARVYTPAVFVVAFAVALVPPLAFDAAWMEWIYRALVLLVIACPCALVISTPVTIVSGLAAAARRGILIKGGVYLEGGHALRWLALDKTGTITHGKPVQTDFHAVKPSEEERARSVAASLAARSDHPVSQAIARAASDAGITLQEVSDFAAIPGRGIMGVIGGRVYHLGNRRLMDKLRFLSSELNQLLDTLEEQGKSAVMLASDDDGVLAAFAVADTVRNTSKQAIADLHALGVRTIMLTGDNQHTANAIAAQVGIDEARGNLLPTDKLEALQSLHDKRGKIGMAGDGINDAPALAKADIGFAMGAAGTDTAIETADVALMDDDLRKIPTFVRLSKKTAAILKQNIGLALAIKAVFIALTFTGDATMWMAVFADMGASLLVVFNGLRLLSPTAA